MNSERISGIWNRCLVAGVTSTHFLISHLIEGLLMLLLQLIFNAIYSIYFLSPLLSLSAALLICMLLLFIGLVGLLFGLLSSIVMKTQLGSYMMAEFAIFQILYISGELLHNFFSRYWFQFDVIALRSFMAIRGDATIRPTHRKFSSAHPRNHSLQKHCGERSQHLRHVSLSRLYHAGRSHNFVIDLLYLVESSEKL